jgi:hypothetical protein
MTGDVVVETGAYDGPGPGPKNYVGFYLASGTISVGWRSFLHFIQSQKDDLGPAVSIQNHLNIGDPNSPTLPALFLLDGYWDRDNVYMNYILNNECQAAVCN